MSTTTITQQQAVLLAKRLEGLGVRLENQGSPDWFIVASAAALIESLRVGLSAIEPPFWIGIDLAAPGTEQTVRRDFHA